MRHLPALAMTLACALALAGCETGASGPQSAAGDQATWQLAPDVLPTPATTTFEVDVTRTDCNSGVTGKVLPARISYEKERVVIRLDVERRAPGGADCQGNELVRVAVNLSEPLGSRQLVDGGCSHPDAGATTVDCQSDVRLAMPRGLTKADGVPTWEEPPAYTAVVRSSCGERWQGTERITVAGGRVTTTEAIGPAEGTPRGPGGAPTVADLLDEARAAAASGTAEVWVDEAGAPRELILDPYPDALDAQACYLVEQLDPEQ